ncbi:hypothetical protein GCM10010994_32570 [Chelatococcus reniformis]|uniref:Uncharacterized protein n=1 Tax=Chelatococcus reniformis TaxID=1494448 RepID=A0A916UFY2_9HYPH|nr:hypothetical protein GCM10010994_32570 [Chelatococcus reniformis]
MGLGDGEGVGIGAGIAAAAPGAPEDRMRHPEQCGWGCAPARRAGAAIMWRGAVGHPLAASAP